MLPPETPRGLVDALAVRAAEPAQAVWAERRCYVRAAGKDGPLFARFSVDRNDEAVFDHEAEVRQLVGAESALRAPPVLARGQGWLLERAVVAERLVGPRAVSAALAAVEQLMSFELPEAPAASSRGRTVARLARVLRSGLPFRDLARARFELRRTSLPQVTGHGDLYVGNVLFDGSDVWLVDWETAGRWPAGYDLMRLWATLERGDDRELLFECAVALLGSRRRVALERLRHAVFVYTLVGLLGSADAAERAEGEALLHLLPWTRPTGAGA
jgi:hypothetical protein